MAQTEMHLYGSSRLGMATQHTAPDTTEALSGGFGNYTKATFIRGEKLFELTNHLGNVLATISDRRQQNSTGGITVDSYTSDLQSVQDYYPYGMGMPGRRFSGGSYRYGFNGKENDNEVKGLGNQIDYDKRIYDPRVGRFYSVDPLQTKFPFYSPYQFAGNTPIQAIDLDGAEEYHYTMTMDKQGKAVLNQVSVRYSNHHSLLWGLFEFDTKIEGKRYIVDYNGASYHIGFAQYGTGYANAWKGKDFEDNYIKKQGNAEEFESNYVDDNHSQAGSDVFYAMNAQNHAMEQAIPQEEPVSTPAKTTKKASAEVHGGNTASLPTTSPKFDPQKPALTKGNLNVSISTNGFAPDFSGSPYLYPVNGNQKNIVQIKLTGSYSGDFSAANAAAGISEAKAPMRYAWHHLNDFNPLTGTSTMKLVRSNVHIATVPHTGAVKQYEVKNKTTYQQ